MECVLWYMACGVSDMWCAVCFTWYVVCGVCECVGELPFIRQPICLLSFIESPQSIISLPIYLSGR